MSKRTFKKASAEALVELENVNNKIAQSNKQSQRKMIEESSPFSPDITKAFSSYDEYRYLLSLRLREAEVTRKSLIREIDFDLFVTEMQRTNYELMRQGLSPYAKDSKDCYIILHHIGQEFDAPFAELSAEEHAKFGNSKILHSSSEDSWRRDPEKEIAFAAEKSAYWKKRARKDIQILSNIRKPEDESQPFFNRQDMSIEIKKALEKLFLQCTDEDLQFVAGLAQTHLVVKQIGATSIDEFAAGYRIEKGEKIKCPACDSTSITLYGTYKTEKEQKQKYKCSKCGKVFSGLHNTLAGGSPFSIFQWVCFIDCLYNGYSIKKTAELCGISNKTAFEKRVVLFCALSFLEENIQLEGNIGIDETYFPVSIKGNRDLQKHFKKTRASRARGSENHTPGLSIEKASVVCALDEYGTSIAVVTGYGNASAKKLDEALRDYINPKRLKMLHSDQSRAIKRFATMNAFPIQQTKSKDIRHGRAKKRDTVRHVQRVNAYHSRLKKFLDRYNGVSSELLQGYVSLFAWRERNRDRERSEAYRELLGVLITPTMYMNPMKFIDDLLEKFEGNLPDNAKLYFRNKQSEDKTKNIYDLYAKGMPVKEIAKKFKCSPQAITRRIRNFRAWGLAYKTPKDIAKEKAAEKKRTANYRKIQQYIARGEYLNNLLKEKESWEGSLESFYVAAETKYNLSRQTIKNDIATAKRVSELREPFCAEGFYEYMNSNEIFAQIFARYSTLRQADPGREGREIYKELSEEFGYKAGMIYKIVSTFLSGETIRATGRKMRIPITQTLNRDRSVFIDYLNWTGTHSEFLESASLKYKVSIAEIQKILHLNYIADPRRYEMSKLD